MSMFLASTILFWILLSLLLYSITFRIVSSFGCVIFFSRPNVFLLFQFVRALVLFCCRFYFMVPRDFQFSFSFTLYLSISLSLPLSVDRSACLSVCVRVCVCIWQVESYLYLVYVFVSLARFSCVLYFSETQSSIRCHGSYMAFTKRTECSTLRIHTRVWYLCLRRRRRRSGCCCSECWVCVMCNKKKSQSRVCSCAFDSICVSLFLWCVRVYQFMWEQVESILFELKIWCVALMARALIWCRISMRNRIDGWIEHWM